jgi:hypothetical protein
MNIFYLDYDIKRAAESHVDRHVVKMVTEYAQLLSGAVRLSGIDAGYRLTHKNHPSAVWTRESLDNWLWLRDLASALNEEYRYRYKRDFDHKSWSMIESLPVPDIPAIGFTEFKLAMPDDVKHSDPVIAYRNYYNKYKGHIAKWMKRPVPDWFIYGP